MGIKQNTGDLIQKVLDIIDSSERKMPAHYTGNGNRSQSFCLAFDISEEDEYAMASEAWYSATDSSVVKTGEDVMLSAYIATLLGGEEKIPKLYRIIIDTNAPNIAGDYEEYFQGCSEFGRNRAKVAKV